jgi:hypothetical protein
MIWNCSCLIAAFSVIFGWAKLWGGLARVSAAVIAVIAAEEYPLGISTPQTFEGVTPERYKTLAERARRAGIPLSGNSGSAAMFGIEVCWNYLPETQALTIQCLRTPFFMNQGEVDAKIRNLVEQTAMA